MKIVNSLLLVIAVIMTSGCAGVNSSLQVRSNGIPPAATAAFANTIDQANAALFNGVVGGMPGTFDTRFDMRVQNSRTSIRSDRSWRAY